MQFSIARDLQKTKERHEMQTLRKIATTALFSYSKSSKNDVSAPQSPASAIDSSSQTLPTPGQRIPAPPNENAHLEERDPLSQLKRKYSIIFLFKLESIRHLHHVLLKTPDDGTTTLQDPQEAILESLWFSAALERESETLETFEYYHRHPRCCVFHASMPNLDLGRGMILAGYGVGCCEEYVRELRSEMLCEMEDIHKGIMEQLEAILEKSKTTRTSRWAKEAGNGWKWKWKGHFDLAWNMKNIPCEEDMLMWELTEGDLLD
ncbi:hypothetical protein BP6252_01279 [Coleophoma cylindrospora]|uniref:Uncharacterized protein n=1 Tax=Coleophoma cylindrospora TaxID=1849047 RepID=A0A3D8SSH2_9HELO|nr:hypothetical protein BP6252_01279 [Coleophoma cylindrospora]